MCLVNKSFVYFYKNKIVFSDACGLIVLDIKKYINLFNFRLVDKKLLCLENIDKKLDLSMFKFELELKIKSIVLNLSYVFKKKLIIFGIGFRSWVYFLNNTSIYLILKIGFSRDLFIKIPSDIKLICLKPTLIILKGFNKYKLNQFASYLHSLKKPDPYKGKGIQYLNEVILLKPGKKN